jgi:hypothetical protein
MNYSNTFSKAWNIVWNNKFMIVLGILASMANFGSSSGGSQGVANDGFNFNYGFSEPFRGLDIPVWAIFLILVIFAIAVMLWALSLISRGGLVYGADVTSRGQASSFSEAFQAGLKKVWQLIGIGLVPAIPMIGLVGLAFVGFRFYFTNSNIINDTIAYIPNTFLVLPLVGILLLVFLVLSLLQTFAERACMLEDTNVFGSYRRGLQVLGKNLGEAIVLFLLQIVVSIVIGIALFLPGIIAAMCCILWPLVIAMQGAFAAFYSSLWTISWNEWTTPS